MSEDGGVTHSKFPLSLTATCTVGHCPGVTNPGTTANRRPRSSAGHLLLPFAGFCCSSLLILAAELRVIHHDRRACALGPLGSSRLAAGRPWQPHSTGLGQLLP